MLSTFYASFPSLIVFCHVDCIDFMLFSSELEMIVTLTFSRLFKNHFDLHISNYQLQEFSWFSPLRKALEDLWLPHFMMWRPDLTSRSPYQKRVFTSVCAPANKNTMKSIRKLQQCLWGEGSCGGRLKAWWLRIDQKDVLMRECGCLDTF